MKTIKKSISLVLSLVMILSVFSVCIPAVSANAADAKLTEYSAEELRDISDRNGYALTDSEIDAITAGERSLSDTVADREEDVTLIVQLEDDPILADNAQKMFKNGELTFSGKLAQRSIARKQAKAESKIEDAVFDGEDIEVLYNYTLLSNAIAITAKASQIDEIAAIKGVKSVFSAPEFEAIPTNADGDATYAADYFTGSDNTTSYKGTGTVVAVIDTGLDLTHSAFLNAVSSPKLDADDVAAVITQTHAYERNNNVAADELYRSTKVPYAFNYADESYDVSHDHDDEGDHGTHVSGIIAGYEVNGEGEVKFEGVAPDAQLVVMKVFGDRRAGNYADLLAAVEDAVILGADAINLSLGSWGGFTYAGDYPAVEEVYQRAANAGIVVSAAAGNDYSAGYGTLYGNNLSLASNPDNGIVSSPASYDDNLAVASAASKAYYAKFISISGRNITYTCNSTDQQQRRNIERYAGQTLGYTVLQNDDGEMLKGSLAEFDAYAEACGVEGKFVVVRRGLTFTETVDHAQKYGAIGLIVCNNVNGALVNMAENTAVTIPAIFISKADGDFIAGLASSTGELTVSTEAGFAANPAAGTMSEFSSWGVTSDLKLKPEITGYGGNVYSTRNHGAYGLMSGTSMATPYVAGVAALVAQRYNAEAPDPAAAADAKKAYAVSVMMSTATPVIEASGTPYSPRKQGAGLVNIDAALATNAYVQVEGSPTPKLDIGDDKTKSGVYSMTFSVVNFGDTDLSFNVSSTVQTEKVEIQDVSYLTERIDPEKADAFKATGIGFLRYYHSERVYVKDELSDVKFMSGLPYDLSGDASVGGDSTVTVPACETVSVTVTVTLGAEAKAYMDENFVNGVYIEGFITLTSLTEGQPDLVVPYMGFYGDWTAAPILDEGTWEDKFTGEVIHPQMDVSYGVNVYYGPMIGYIRYPLGTLINTLDDPYDFYAANVEYVKTASNTFGGEEGFDHDTVGAELALLRNVKHAVVTVSDAETGEVYATKNLEYMRKSRYYGDESLRVINAGYYAEDMFKWNGTIDGTEEKVPGGTLIEYKVQTYIDYGDEAAQNNANNVFKFYATYDGNKPTLDEVQVHTDPDTGDTLMDFTISDDTVLANMKLCLIGYNASGQYTHAYVDYPLFPNAQNVTRTVNITQDGLANGIARVRCIEIYEITDFCDRRAVYQPLFDAGYITPAQNFYFPFLDNMNAAFVTKEGTTETALAGNVLGVGKTCFIKPLNTFGLGYQDASFHQMIGDDGNNSDYGIYEDVIFSSSDESIATVNVGGQIQAKAPGYVYITAEGAYGHAKATVRLRVINTMLQQQIDSAAPGSTVYLTDGDLTESVTINKDLTLDLGGAEITGVDGASAVTVSGGNVTIQNGVIKAEYSPESENPLLQDILADAVPAVKVTGGSLTLSGVTVTGPTAELNGRTPAVGSAVKVTNGAALTVKDSELTGLYAVNNKDVSEAPAGNVMLISGHFEGLLGAVADISAVTKGEGTAFVDVAKIAQGETPRYTGTADGYESSVLMPTPGLYFSASDIASATTPDGATVAYDEERDCAVFSINKDGTFRKFSTLYLAIPCATSFTASTYKFAVINMGGVPSDAQRIVFSASATPKNTNSGDIYAPDAHGMQPGESVDVIKNLAKNANFTGTVSTLYFWPAYSTWAQSSFDNFPDIRSWQGDIDIYSIAFFKTEAEAYAYVHGTSVLSTPNLLVANAETFDSKFAFEGTSLNVDVHYNDVSNGTYDWVPADLSLYKKIDNGDNTYSEELIETKTVAMVAERNASAVFENIDPAAIYTVKSTCALKLKAENSTAYFNVAEEDVNALISALPDLIEDMFRMDVLHDALVRLVDLYVFKYREGFVARDALHIDCPCSQSKVASTYPYYEDYPDVIGRKVKNSYGLWTDLWDGLTLSSVLTGYLVPVAKILGQAEMQELMTGLEETLPASVWEAQNASARTGSYGYTGYMNLYNQILDYITAAFDENTGRDALIVALNRLGSNLDTLYKNVALILLNMQNDSSSSDYVVYDMLGNADGGSFGLYNENHDLAVEIEQAVAEVNAALQAKKDLFMDSFGDTGLYNTVLNYKGATRVTALLQSWFDGVAFENGEYALDESTVFEAEASYDGYITYHLNGGENAEANAPGYQTALPTLLAEPTRLGYSFGGWYTTADFADGTEMTVTPDTDIGDIELYAKWTVTEFTLTFMVNGETYAAVPYAYGAQTAAPEAPVVNGSVFKYWYLNNPFEAYTFGTMPANDVTLTALLENITLDDLAQVDGVYQWPFTDVTPVRFEIYKDCVIDFSGSTLTNIGDLAAIVVYNGAKVTLKNLTIAPSADTYTNTEYCALLVTGNAEVTLENCNITGAMNVEGDCYADSAVKVDWGTLHVSGSVLTGLYAVNNRKSDSAYDVPVVTVENSILLGAANDLTVDSANTSFAGTELPASDILAEEDRALAYADSRFIAYLTLPEFTWEYDADADQLTVTAVETVVSLPDGSVISVVPDEVQLNGDSYTFTLDEVYTCVIEGVAAAASHHEIKVLYAYNAALSAALSKDLVNVDDMVITAVQKEVAEFDALVATYDEMIAQWMDHKQIIKDKFYQAQATNALLRVYIPEIRSRLEHIGGADYTGNSLSGKGLIPTLDEQIGAYKALETPAEKLAWLMEHKAAVIDNTVLLNDDFVTLYDYCSTLNGLSIVFTGDDYSDWLSYVEDIRNLSTELRNAAERNPSIAAAEFAAAENGEALVNEILSAEASPVAEAEINKELTPLEQTDAFDTIAVNFILTDEYTGEETVTTFYIRTGETTPDYVPEEVEGRTFTGWTMDPLTLPVTEINYRGSLTLNTYNVTFKAEDSEDIVIPVSYGDTIEIPDVPAREHYTQTDPYWDTDLTGVEITEDLTVNAVYMPDVYTVTYKAEDSDDIEIEVTYGDTVEVPAVPVREHYTQTEAYWDTDLEGVVIGEDTEVNAVYTPDVYTVTYKAEGSDDIEIEVTYGDTVEVPAVPVREHYTQTEAYWDTDLEGVVIGEDTEVNAVYTPDVYTLYFVDLEDVTVEVTYGEAAADIPEIPVKEHYTQTDPYWTEDLIDAAPFDFDNVEADAELYICYTPDVYTVTFIADDEVIAETEVTYGEALTEIPEIPAKEHYEQTEPVWSVTDFDAIGEDTVVTAVYTPDVYVVTYTAEDSDDIVIEVTYGNTFEVPAVPVREHYTQTAPYWENDLTGVIVDADTEVRAIYTPDVYTVTWDMNGSVTTEDYTYGETPVFKGETAKACTATEYYVFTGWTPEITAAAEDITYTAVFETRAKDSNYTTPENLTAAYGSTLASIDLPYGFVWKDATQSVGNVGTNTFIAVYTPDDTEHYLTEEVEVTVTVTKADPIVNVPEVYGVTGHKLSETALPDGWTWNTPDAVLGSVGSTTYQATYTPADTANYNPITVSIPFSVIVPAQYCAMNGHNYNSTKVVNPTCTANGYTTHICGMCGASYNDSSVRALGHNYVSSITLAPTCTANGVRTYKCTRCDSSYNEVIGANGHRDANGDGICDVCETTLCTHLCHTNNAFMRVIWRIVNFFNKLFKINKYCSCGAQHW